jgi:hypothetical protein
MIGGGGGATIGGGVVDPPELLEPPPPPHEERMDASGRINPSAPMRVIVGDDFMVLPARSGTEPRLAKSSQNRICRAPRA